MHDDEWIDWGEARRQLEARLEKPISRQLLYQSVKPVMVDAGDLRQYPRYSTFRRSALERWAYYMNSRQRKIDSGEWQSKRPYSVEDLKVADAERLAGERPSPP